MGKVKQKTYKTTSEHFKIFQEECSYWIEYFGIIDHRIGFYHIDDSNSYGYCCVNKDRSDRCAGLYLSTDFGINEPTEFQVRKTAFHELCELMFLKISDSLPVDRQANLVHEMIRRFENTIFRDSYHRRFSNVKAKPTTRKLNKSN